MCILVLLDLKPYLSLQNLELVHLPVRIKGLIFSDFIKTNEMDFLHKFKLLVEILNISFSIHLFTDDLPEEYTKNQMRGCLKIRLEDLFQVLL